ncbi:MAG: DHA2 family efflux MFS transporter permease subunit [Gemmatimonadales bacterium]
MMPAVDPSADKYRYKYLIGIAVTMAAMLELIDTSIVNVAIPHMMGNLGATLDEISWVSTGYIIANVIVIPMSGWLSAYFGRRRYLTGSIALFVLASFCCGAARSLESLVFWRVVQGLGGGALLSTAQATLWEAFPPDEVQIGQAMFGVGIMVGPTLGPTLGGFIVDNWEWPWIFYINLPLGMIAGFMVWTYVKDAVHQERAKTVDWLGIGLLTTGVGALQWMLERGERYDWFESRFVTSLGVVAAASFVGLIWRELTAKEPVINFRVLKSRQLATGVAMAMLLGFALFGSVFVLPVFLQGLHGFTANQTGLVILPGAIASAVTMAVLGRLGSKLDARPLIAVGVLGFLWCMWSLSQLTLDAGAGDLFWPLIVRGVSLGIIFIPLTSASMAELVPKEIPEGTGMFNLTRQLGGSLGIAIVATLLSRFTFEAKSQLTQHVATIGVDAQARLEFISRGMVARGMNPAISHQQALLVMDRMVSGQASVLAFSRIYLISGIALCASIPLMLFWHHGKGRAVVQAH